MTLPDRTFPCTEATVDLRFPGFMLRFWLDREQSLNQLVDRVEVQRMFASAVVEVLKTRGIAEKRSLSPEDIREVLGLFADHGEVHAVQLVHTIDTIPVLEGMDVVVSHGGMIYSVEFA